MADVKDASQQAEIEVLCAHIETLDLPEGIQGFLAPDVLEISQEAFGDLLCKNLKQKMAAAVVIDVRSESEYAKNGIPTAFSLPILSDRERHEVGLLYKRHNHKIALRYALYLAREKEAAYVAKARLFSGGAPLVLYCWRGGGRSAYVAGLLERHGLSVSRLQGGWKGFRKQVQHLLYHGNFTLWPFSGSTGCGKSEMLELLETRHPEVPVLHLEAAAGHAASVFGHLRFSRRGLPLAADQQSFETRLYLLLLRRRGDDGCFPPFFTEMESRKIGAVHVPPALFRALEKGPHIRLESAMDLRVKRLRREYFGEDGDGLAGVQQALTYLTRHVGGAVVCRWQALLEAGEVGTFLEEILREYYDKGYKGAGGLPARIVCSDDIDAAVRILFELWQDWVGIQGDPVGTGTEGVFSSPEFADTAS